MEEDVYYDKIMEENGRRRKKMKPENLAELIHIFMADPDISPTRKSMTKTAVRYAVKTAGLEGPQEISVSAISRSLKDLKRYLATNCHYLSQNTRRNYCSFFSRLEKWALEKNLIPFKILTDLLPEWIPVSAPIQNATSGRKGWRDAIRKLGFWSSSFGLTPAQLTPSHLMDYQNYLREESGVKAWRQIYNRGNHEWKLHIENGSLPNLFWPPLPKATRSPYGLKLEKWPEQMQKKYKHYRDWCTASFVTNRDRKYRQKNVSADQNLSTVERIAGFVHNILRIPIEDLTIDIFFQEEIITKYFNWMVETRLQGVTVTLERIAAMLLGMARGHFQRLDAEEWLVRLKQQVENAPVRDKFRLLQPIRELTRVPDAIRDRRLKELERA
ncbi:MAG: hypothetical protein V3U24_03655, partial [Candidatus Neomarinimicrobiota bacterium]